MNAVFFYLTKLRIYKYIYIYIYSNQIIILDYLYILLLNQFSGSYLLGMLVISANYDLVAYR